MCEGREPGLCLALDLFRFFPSQKEENGKFETREKTESLDGAAASLALAVLVDLHLLSRVAVRGH